MDPKKLAWPKYWEKGIHELSITDPILAKIIQRNKEIKLYSHQNPFLTLLRAIVSQQISSLAAKKLSKKILFLTSLENCTSTGNLKENVDASVFLASKSSFKRLGLSRAKYSCITEVATSLKNNKQYWENLDSLSDHEILSALMRIKGIGMWTGQMFLIFHLMRPNVFPETDLGLLKSIRKNYSLNDYVSVKEQLPNLKREWDPWLSIAAWYLWCDIDPVPFVY
ncbi:hypothetical protein N9U60_03015 [Betaproteobacteria bacterium]|nr:hypothetical protein [Betaproteobacteria bacterium]